MKRMTIRQICFRTAVLAAAAGMLCGCAGTGHPASPSDELSVTVSGTGQTSETGTTILNTKDSTAVPVTNGSTAEETAPRQTETSGTTAPETDAPTGGNDTDKPDDTSADTSKGTSAETSEEKPPVPAKDGFNGICFAVPGAQSRGLDTDRLFDLVGAMNAGAFRNWMHATEILNGPTEVNKKQYERQKKYIAALRERGVTKIVGMSHYWFWPEGYDCSDHGAVPYWSSNPASDFRKWLEVYEQTWYTMASLFPEIDYWEIGNEFNMDSFLHPRNYYSTKTPFTLDEKAQIVTEMCFAASRAIHKANPDATVIFPGMAPEGGFTVMEKFLDLVYCGIESGEYGNGSTDPDDYFDAVAWHCYVFKKFDIEKWVGYNNAVYAVMQKHGEGDKRVFLTEFGFSDGGKQAADAEQGGYLTQIYEACRTRMTYVDSIYPFRLIEDETAASWGGTIEIYYGMFRVFGLSEFGAKEKAKALCRCYGGDVESLDMYIGDNSVYPR